MTRHITTRTTLHRAILWTDGNEYKVEKTVKQLAEEISTNRYSGQLRDN